MKKVIEIEAEYGSCHDALDELGYVECDYRFINVKNGSEIDMAVYGISAEKDEFSVDNYYQAYIYTKNDKEYAFIEYSHSNTLIHTITLLEL